MNYHTRYAAILKPVEACLIGGGAFGQSLVAQSRGSMRINTRIVVDVTTSLARRAFEQAGIAPECIRECADAASAEAAFGAGDHVAADSIEAVLGLAFDILVEATGHPEAGARHALRAIAARRHVMLVTKETDSVVGPLLAHRAAENGVGITPVDGDQPSLLIDLVTWAEVLGFTILCAGKSSEYDFVVEGAEVRSNGVPANAPALAGLMCGADAAERATRREGALKAHFPLRAVPDLCEMAIVANATNLSADRPDFHAPVARIPEVADLLREGALLSGTRRIDVFHHIRHPDEASFAGGVFVIVACDDASSWQVLAEKGHVVSADGKAAMIYLPRHLLGLEAGTSLLDLAGLGVSSYGPDYRPRVDVVAVASRDLAAGEVLTARGHHHTIEGVAAQIRPASPLKADMTCPYYLVANRKLARPVDEGAAIRLSDLVIEPDSVLLALRREQDALFLPHC